MKTFLTCSPSERMLMLSIDLLLFPLLLLLLLRSWTGRSGRRFLRITAELLALLVYFWNLVIRFYGFTAGLTSYAVPRVWFYRIVWTLLQMPYYGHWLFTGLLFTFLILDMEQQRKTQQNSLTVYSIMEAIHDLPDGICISGESGVPILINHKMYAIYSELTGADLQNASDLIPLVGGTFRLEDHSVWKFRRRLLDRSAGIYETIACNVSVSYMLKTELEEKTGRLRLQQLRLKNLLANIASVQKEEEILASRIRIHDELGQILLASRQLLKTDNRGEARETGIDRALADWEKLIRLLSENMADLEPYPVFKAEELQKAAAVVGCRIEGLESLEEASAHLPLLLAAIRECMINAVHHGRAKVVRISYRTGKGQEILEISDDGRGNGGQPLQERGGLKNLRSRVEEAGGVMTTDSRAGVCVTISLPDVR